MVLPIIMVCYDCFTFFNELDLLEIRLRELSDVVDVFVLAESPWTFQGQPKPLLFDENRHRFRPYLSRIRHIVTGAPADAPDAWAREFHQRNSLREGMLDAEDDSLVMVSDVDEIARPEAVLEIQRRQHFCFLRMEMYLYFLNWHAHPWIKAYGAPWSFVRDMEDLSAPRMVEAAYLHRFGEETALHVIEDAGWHMSWMGGVARMMEKLGAFSHTEPEVQRWRDAADLQAEVAARRFFYDKVPLETVPLGTLPRLIRERPAYYRSAGLLAADDVSLLHANSLKRW
jgi:beta-1,4-mannosyl-glycoprotein beta-1,4-N-acetylglucosaminyltransferase